MTRMLLSTVVQMYYTMIGDIHGMDKSDRRKIILTGYDQQKCAGRLTTVGLPSGERLNRTKPDDLKVMTQYD